MGKKCCCRNRFYDWSYNNPRIDRKLTDLHKRLSELDDILCARKKSEKKRKKSDQKFGGKEKVATFAPAKRNQR